jgi:hypothetical protein
MLNDISHNTLERKRQIYYLSVPMRIQYLYIHNIVV